MNWFLASNAAAQISSDQPATRANAQTYDLIMRDLGRQVLAYLDQVVLIPENRKAIREAADAVLGPRSATLTRAELTDEISAALEDVANLEATGRFSKWFIGDRRARLQAAISEIGRRGDALDDFLDWKTQDLSPQAGEDEPVVIKAFVSLKETMVWDPEVVITLRRDNYTVEFTVNDPGSPIEGITGIIAPDDSRWLPAGGLKTRLDESEHPALKHSQTETIIGIATILREEMKRER